MKRTTTLIAALAGAAVLIAGCSSTSGTATPSSSPTSSAAQVSASAVASTSVAAPSSAPESGSGESSAPAGTVADRSGAASSAAPASTALDAKSAAWFSVACGGLTPLTGVSSLMGSLGSDLSSAAKKLTGVLTLTGSSLTKASAQLKKMPAPTVAGGDALATKTIAAFETAGPEISAAAKKIEADPSTLLGAVTGLQNSFTKAAEPVSELGKLSPETVAAIEKLPACAKIASLAGG